MPADLVDFVTELRLHPAALAIRDPDTEVPALTVSDPAAVAWDALGASYRPSTGQGVGWAFRHERYMARATLPCTGWGSGLGEVHGGDGGARVDEGRAPAYRYTVDGVTERWARTAEISASRLRAWLAIEPLAEEPGADVGAEGATAVTYRVWNGSAELWWNGAAWAAAGAGEWNTEAELVAHAAELPGTVRTLAITAKLSTTDERYAPAFYGARIAYSCSVVDDLDDALIRTVLASLRSEVRAVAVDRFTTSATLAEVDLGTGPAGDTEVGGEWAYDVTDVAAVFNLTDELAPLAGTWDSGTATWTPTTPISSGQALRLEVLYRPHLVVSVHREAQALERLPAVYIAPTGTPDTFDGAASELLVRDVTGAVPTAIGLAGGTTILQRLEVRIIAGLAADVRRLRRALRAWLGPGGFRRLVSPETGMPITVREVAPPVDTTDTLAQGVAEARAEWVLTYAAHTAETVSPVTLLRDSGLTVTLPE